MRVYQISHKCYGKGWLDKDPMGFKYELETALEEASLLDKKIGFVKKEIEQFLSLLPQLTPEKRVLSTVRLLQLTRLLIM